MILYFSDTIKLIFINTVFNRHLVFIHFQRDLTGSPCAPLHLEYNQVDIPILLDDPFPVIFEVVISVFLFDSLYATDPPERDIVKTLSDKLLEKRRTHPNLSIAIVLDPSHKAYGQRLSPVERAFRENGIDVFYSDLLSGLKKAIRWYRSNVDASSSNADLRAKRWRVKH